MTVAATAASLATPSGTRSPAISASETPIPPGTGTIPWNRLVTTTTTVQGIRPRGDPTAYRLAQRMRPQRSWISSWTPNRPIARDGDVNSWAKADHADLSTGTARSRSRLTLQRAATAATETRSTTASTTGQLTEPSDVADRSADTAPVPNATTRTTIWAMKPDRPSMPPWATATVGGTPYLYKNAAVIVTRPATPGMANEMNAMALCRTVAGHRGRDRPTENIMEAACGRYTSWPTAIALSTTHQTAPWSSAQS